MHNFKQKPRLSESLNSKLTKFSLITGLILSIVLSLLIGSVSFFLKVNHDREMLAAISGNVSALAQNSDFKEIERVLAGFIEHLQDSEIYLVKNDIAEVSLPNLEKIQTKYSETPSMNIFGYGFGNKNKIQIQNELLDNRSHESFGKIILFTSIIGPAIVAASAFGISFLIFMFLLTLWRNQTKKALEHSLKPFTLLHDDMTLIGSGQEPKTDPLQFEIEEFYNMSGIIKKQYSDVKHLTKVIASAEGEKRASESVRSVLHDLANPYTAISNLVKAYLLYPEDLEIKTTLQTRFPDLDNHFLELLKSARQIQTECLNIVNSSLFDTVKIGVEQGAVKNPDSIKIFQPENLENFVVRHDPNLLARAIANIVRNAIEEGATKVEIWLNDDPLEIHIRDNGPGIPQSKISALLEGRLKSEKPDGSGIGFPTALRLIKAHRGKIILEEGNKVGAHFRLNLSELRNAI